MPDRRRSMPSQRPRAIAIPRPEPRVPQAALPPLLLLFLLLLLMMIWAVGCSSGSSTEAVADTAPPSGSAAVAATDAVDGYWPTYRGPQRDGKTPSTVALLKDWPETGPPTLWSTPLGAGYSGLVIGDGRLFTAFNRGGEELLGAFDATTGESLWTFPLGDAYTDGMGDGPRSTPVLDGGTVYVLSAKGILHAVDAASGSGGWQVDLVDRFGARIPRWGASAQPLVMEDRVLVDAGGPSGNSVVALARADGETLWAVGDDRAGYSQPLPITIDGVSQVVFFTATRLQSVNPTSGKLLWQKEWATDWDVNAATPIFVEPNRLFVSSGYDTGSALLELKRSAESWDVSEVWRSRRLKNQFSSSVRVGDHLYGFDNKIFKCIELATGNEVWKTRGFQHGSLVYGDGDLYVLGEEGRLALVEATPSGYREKASVQIFNSKAWTPPTLLDGRLFLRDEARLVSLDVRAAASANS